MEIPKLQSALAVGTPDGTQAINQRVKKRIAQSEVEEVNYQQSIMSSSVLADPRIQTE